MHQTFCHQSNYHEVVESKQVFHQKMIFSDHDWAIFVQTKKEFRPFHP